jgi:hypothetical protein
MYSKYIIKLYYQNSMILAFSWSTWTRKQEKKLRHKPVPLGSIDFQQRCQEHIVVLGKLGIQKNEIGPLSHITAKVDSRTGGLAQAVELLVCKCKALSSNPSPNNKMPFGTQKSTRGGR